MCETMSPSDRIPRDRSLGSFGAPNRRGRGSFAFPNGGEMAARPITAAMAIQCLEMLNLPVVTQSTIRSWAERGKVKRYGLDQYGLQKYELQDIIREASNQKRAVA